MAVATALPGNAARPIKRVSRIRQANRLAEQITGRSYLSYSQVALMRSCPRKFAYTYVENAPKDFIASSLIFGSSLHAALELYFRCHLEGVSVTTETLMSAYADRRRRELADAGKGLTVRFGNKEDQNTLHELADRMLAAFLASPLSKPKGKILGIEEQVQVKLGSEIPDLLAQVDLVTQTNDALHVVDWKTSRSRWTEQKAVESGEQLLVYGTAMRDMAGSLAVPVRLHFAIITKHKTPLVQSLRVPTDINRIAVLKDNLKQVWSAICSGNFYASPSPLNCTNCPFKSRCPVFVGR